MRYSRRMHAALYYARKKRVARIASATSLRSFSSEFSAEFK